MRRKLFSSSCAALLVIAGACLLSLPGVGQPKEGRLVATDFPSIHAALDEAGKRGGGEVFLPAGVYEVHH